jgi:hypothetical protein
MVDLPSFDRYQGHFVTPYLAVGVLEEVHTDEHRMRQRILEPLPLS